MSATAHPRRYDRPAWRWPEPLALLWLAAAAWLGLTSGPARAETALRACVARVETGDDARLLFASPQRFDCASRQTSFGPGDFWVRLDGTAFPPAEPILRIAPYW